MDAALTCCLREEKTPTLHSTALVERLALKKAAICSVEPKTCTQSWISDYTCNNTPSCPSQTARLLQHYQKTPHCSLVGKYLQPRPITRTCTLKPCCAQDQLPVVLLLNKKSSDLHCDLMYTEELYEWVWSVSPASTRASSTPSPPATASATLSASTATIAA